MIVLNVVIRTGLKGPEKENSMAFGIEALNVLIWGLKFG